MGGRLERPLAGASGAAGRVPNDRPGVDTGRSDESAGVSIATQPLIATPSDPSSIGQNAPNA